MTPNIKGNYEPIGPYNGKPSYQLAGNGWFIWWEGPENWTISTERGVISENYWTRFDPNIEGLYDPAGSSEGAATVTEI